MASNLSIEFAGIKFPNPFVLASRPAPTTPRWWLGFRRRLGRAVLKTTSVESEVVELVYPMLAGLDFEGRRVVGLGTSTSSPNATSTASSRMCAT